MKVIKVFLALMLISLSVMPNMLFAKNLKLGVLPAADSILLYTAKENELFAKNNLDIEIVPFQSAVELITAIRSGAIDLYFTDTINVYLLHSKFKPQNIIATTSHSNPNERFFGVAVGPKSQIKSIQELQEVANASVTITDYIFDLLRQEHKLAADQIKKLEIKQIGVRLQMLLAGQIEAAVLPEPLLSLVEAKGGRVIIDDSSLDMPLAVIAMPKELVTDDFVQAFQNSLFEAGEAINADPNKYRQLMLDKKLLPPELLDTFTLSINLKKVPFSLPQAEHIKQTLKWMQANKIIEQEIELEDVIYTK